MRNFPISVLVRKQLVPFFWAQKCDVSRWFLPINLLVPRFLVKWFWPQYLRASTKTSSLGRGSQTCPVKKKPVESICILKKKPKKVINMKHIWLFAKTRSQCSSWCICELPIFIIYNIMLVNWIIMVFICTYLHNHACMCIYNIYQSGVSAYPRHRINIGIQITTQSLGT